jgi:hypothetical protein
MLIVLIPVAVVVLAGWITWKIHVVVSGVPRSNDELGGY